MSDMTIDCEKGDCSIRPEQYDGFDEKPFAKSAEI